MFSNEMNGMEYPCVCVLMMLEVLSGSRVR